MGGLGIGFICAVLFELIGWTLDYPSGWIEPTVSGMVGLTIIFGFFLAAILASRNALALGGAYYLYHQVIRSLMARSQLGPWRYVGFLNEAVTLRLLRSEPGGGYTFVHPLLQHHFFTLRTRESDQVTWYQLAMNELRRTWANLLARTRPYYN
jgi:hypothetical protein